MRKRYMFTLTTENVEKFQKMVKDAGLPNSTLSSAIDDFIRDIIPIMERATSAGKITVVDLFRYMGEQVQSIIEEEKQHAEKRKEEKKTRISR